MGFSYSPLPPFLPPHLSDFKSEKALIRSQIPVKGKLVFIWGGRGYVHMSQSLLHQVSDSGSTLFWNNKHR